MNKDESNQVSTFLQALNRELENLQSMPLYYLRVDIDSPTIRSLLELENRAPTILSSQDSILCNLYHLKTLINNLKDCQYYSPRSFIQRGLISYQISRVVLLIQKEIQLYFDRVNIQNLVQVLQESDSEEAKLRVLNQFEDRLSSGFDRELQELILRARLFTILESILCDDSCPPTVRENAGSAILALAQFNRNVFVGIVLMGVAIPKLVLMGSRKSLQILTDFVKLIRGPLVDEMELNGEIPRIIGLLSSEDLDVKLMAMHCLFEIAYFGRKEVIETMIESGLVEKLVIMQRTELEDNLSEMSQIEDELMIEEDDSWTNNPFYGCVARFIVQVEVGEGMVKREKRDIKKEILERARGASISEAEAATFVAEVLWGSHP